MPTNKKPIIAINADAGRKLSIAGGSYRIVLSGTQTNGEFAVIEMTVPPGAGANPHAHPNIVETFSVVEGEVTFKSELGNYLAQKGSFVKIPKGGIVHGFKNHTETQAVLLCTVYPAGLDDCFIEFSNLLEANPNMDDLEKIKNIKAIAEKYGNETYPSNYFDKK